MSLLCGRLLSCPDAVTLMTATRCGRIDGEGLLNVGKNAIKIVLLGPSVQGGHISQPHGIRLCCHAMCQGVWVTNGVSSVFSGDEIIRPVRIYNWTGTSARHDRGCDVLECRQAGAISQLVRMLSSGDESSLTAAAVWAILQLAGDSPENKKVGLPPCTCTVTL